MCLTAPVRVLEVGDGTATVAAGDTVRTVSALAVPEVRPGDWALLGAGILVRVLDPAVADQLAAAFRTASGASS